MTHREVALPLLPNMTATLTVRASGSIEPLCSQHCPPFFEVQGGPCHPAAPKAAHPPFLPPSACPYFTPQHAHTTASNLGLRNPNPFHCLLVLCPGPQTASLLPVLFLAPGSLNCEAGLFEGTLFTWSQDCS